MILHFHSTRLHTIEINTLTSRIIHEPPRHTTTRPTDVRPSSSVLCTTVLLAILPLHQLLMRGEGKEGREWAGYMEVLRERDEGVRGNRIDEEKKHEKI
jgi:hypothetical protein